MFPPPIPREPWNHPRKQRALHGIPTPPLPGNPVHSTGFSGLPLPYSTPRESGQPASRIGLLATSTGTVYSIPTLPPTPDYLRDLPILSTGLPDPPPRAIGFEYWAPEITPTPLPWASVLGSTGRIRVSGFGPIPLPLGSSSSGEFRESGFRVPGSLGPNRALGSSMNG